MSRYIDAELAEKAMKKLEREDIAAYGDDCESVFDSTAAIYALRDVPTADVAPVVHAHWLGTEYDGYADGCPVFDTWECSNCREEVCNDGEEPPFNYCPNCGARMDERSDEDAEIH